MGQHGILREVFGFFSIIRISVLMSTRCAAGVGLLALVRNLADIDPGATQAPQNRVPIARKML
jgi:hypothetical protein